jgi:hypothetical protein
VISEDSILDQIRLSLPQSSSNSAPNRSIVIVRSQKIL